jgi:hypothetical protein
MKKKGHTTLNQTLIIIDDVRADPNFNKHLVGPPRSRLLDIVGYSTSSATQHRRLLNIINLVRNRNKETN